LVSGNHLGLITRVYLLSDISSFLLAGRPSATATSEQNEASVFKVGEKDEQSTSVKANGSEAFTLVSCSARSLLKIDARIFSETSSNFHPVYSGI
jgi:hypothetical protein